VRNPLSHPSLLGRILLGCASVVLSATAISVNAQSATPLRVAEQPGARPNFIFPLNSCATSSTTNVQQFQSVQFRPLYFYGAGSSSILSPLLSIANTPVLSRDQKTVSILLKNWRFANHSLVSAASVLFYLNLYRAAPTSVCGYTQHLGVPDQITSVTANGQQLRITFATTVNLGWLQANYLSQIVPLSLTWSTNGTSAVPGCATGTFAAPATVSACAGVLSYLRTQGAITSSFAQPFWQLGVDGPYRLSNFGADGTATFVTNTSYSGTVKPRSGSFVEVPMHSYLQEISALRAGNLDLGYIAPADLPVHTSRSGNATDLPTFRLTESTANQTNFIQINRTATNSSASLLNQLYIRQALQQSLDETAIARVGWKGYALPSTSSLPPSTPVAVGNAGANTLGFSTAKARVLLTSHGWTLSGGVYLCTSPGSGVTNCGVGIANQTPLSFSLLEASGQYGLPEVVNEIISQWRTFGVAATRSFDTFSNTLDRCHSDNTVQLCVTGSGWTYSPQVWPSGEQLFATTSEFNFGHYSDPAMNTLLSAVETTSINLSAFASYAQKQIPVIFLPVPLMLQETRSQLTSVVGVGPSPLGSFTPEYLK